MNEIERWDSCPSMAGLGLHDDGLVTITHSIERLLRNSGRIDCSDVSAWDWTVQEWELELDMEARIGLCHAQDLVYATLARVNAICVANTVFVTPNGKMYSQTSPGVQLSGRYCTSSSNSRMRVMATLLARYRATGQMVVDIDGKEALGIMSMGDDSVEVHCEGIKDGLNEIGHICKMVETHDSVVGVDFCSQIFDGFGNAYPAAPAKTVYRFLSHKASEIKSGDLAAQLAWYFRHLVGEEKETITKLVIARVERAKEEDTNHV